MSSSEVLVKNRRLLTTVPVPYFDGGLCVMTGTASTAGASIELKIGMLSGSEVGMGRVVRRGA